MSTCGFILPFGRRTDLILEGLLGFGATSKAQ